MKYHPMVDNVTENQSGPTSLYFRVKLKDYGMTPNSTESNKLQKYKPL